jgi:metallo-beta-lactamase family protein
MNGECEAYNKNHNANLIPLYNDSDAENALSYIQGYGHNEKIKLNDKVTFEFLPNGHLSGDGSIYITYQKDEYTKKRLLYTGDHNFGREKPFTKKWVEKCLKADCIISESTYSGKDHLKQDNFKVLEDAILDVCVNKKEILFIPCFAIHRQTEVVYMLKQIFDKNKILRNSNIPIYSAGVMSAKAHRILGNPKYKCFYDEKWQELDDVFEWEDVTHIERFKDVSEKLIDNKVKIILSSSGMLSGGYASYLASCFVNRHNVSFLFTGYQAIGSVGDKIMSQEHKTVSIQGKAYLIKANSLGKLDLSGHAGNDELIGLIQSVNQKVLKKVILIHGDDNRKELLKDQLEKVLNDKEIIIPKVGEVIKF